VTANIRKMLVNPIRPCLAPFYAVTRNNS
jgi:hypothetical protein